MTRLRGLILTLVLLLLCCDPTSAGEAAATSSVADGVAATGGQPGDAVYALGTEVQLVVDDVLLARKSGVVRRAHACRKRAAPVLVSEKPWEQYLKGTDQRVYVYGTVLPEEKTGRLRLWYNRGSKALYATSADGVHWQRPELDLIEYGGSKKNNIVFSHFHSPSVVFNPRAEADHRYVMLGCGSLTGRGYYAAHSPDGLHWKLYPRNPILPSSDTCTLALDERAGEYLAFHKRTHEYRGHSRRLVYLATSRDMQQWSEPKLVMAPDAIDDAQVEREGGRYSQFYNMSAFRYGDQFLGLVTHFRYTGPPPRRGPLQSGDDGPIDVQLVHSRDGRTWHRCEDRSPVIPNGPHDYDAGCVLGVSNSFAILGDEIWFYYSAITTTHGGYVPDKKITVAAARWRLTIVRRRADAAELHGLDPFALHDGTAPWLLVCEATRPAVVLGSRQDPSELDLAACEAAGFEVVRRRSGGGVVVLRPGELIWIDIVVPAEEITPVALDDVTVSNVEIDQSTVSFDVDRVGVPVLVRVSYFPNWRADGADGPYRIGPNMMVVVPTAEHVELSFARTPVDYVTLAMTLVGIALCVWWRIKGDMRFDSDLPPAWGGRPPADDDLDDRERVGLHQVRRAGPQQRVAARPLHPQAAAQVVAHGGQVGAGRGVLAAHGRRPTQTLRATLGALVLAGRPWRASGHRNW